MSKRERGEGGLFKMKGSRMWYGQWYQNGKQVRVSLKTDVKEVAKRELRRKIGNAERGAAPENETRKLRYGHLRQALLDDYTRRGNKSLQTLADGTETIWGLAALDKFFQFSEKEQGIHVSAITVDMISVFVRARQKEQIGNAAINRSLALLRRMFNIARKHGKIQFMPVVELLKEPPPRKGFLTLDKFGSLLSCIPLHLKPLIVFLYYCAVRVGEALQIEWSQVDLAAALIRLEQEQTKTDEARIVPLPDVLVRMLRTQEPKEGRVFDGSNLRKEWQRACVAAGFGTITKVEGKRDRYRGLRVHDMRRSGVRNLIEAGNPEKVAMEISGHKTRAVFDRYHIVSAANVTNAMSKLQKHVRSELQKPLTESQNGESIVRGLISEGRK